MTDPGSTTSGDLYWDPFDTEIDSAPYEIWRRLRDEAPVYRNDRYDFYALSRYDDVKASSAAPKRFSSAHGTVLELMNEYRFGGGQMIFMDPPEHTRMRALVSRAFTPRRMAELEDRIRDYAVGLLDAQVGAGSFDFVADFGAVLPSMVISSLLGVSDTDRADIHHLIDTLFHIEPGVGMINDISFQARIDLFEFIRADLERRLAHPVDDMMNDLVHAEITDDDGVERRLTLEEACEFALLLVGAGTETVARLLGWAAVVLDEHPDQRAELAVDGALIPNAVEELLRFEAPSPVQGRWLNEDIELHGQAIPAGSRVLLLTGSAGRDERVYPDADRFDIHRTFDHHMSFGYGVHFCLGAALARSEGRIGIEEALRRFPDFTVDREAAVRLHTSTVRGWSKVPVSI